MMGKKYKDGFIIITDSYLSRTEALRNGFKDIIERDKPSDFTPESYKIELEDIGQWIIQYYRKI